MWSGMPKVIENNELAIFKKMNLSMNLIFCTWLGIRKIHLYGLVHFYGCGQAHLDMPKVITNFKSAICQD